MYLCHFLGSEVIVLFKSIDALYFFEEFFPKVANLVFYMLIFDCYGFQDILETGEVFLYIFKFKSDLLCLLGEMDCLLFSLLLHRFKLLSKVVSVRIVHVECEVVIVLGHFLSEVCQLVIMANKSLFYAFQFTIKVIAGNQLVKQLVHVCKLVHQFGLEGFFVVFRSSFELFNAFNLQ